MELKENVIYCYCTLFLIKQHLYGAFIDFITSRHPLCGTVLTRVPNNKKTKHTNLYLIIFATCGV